MSLPDRAQLDAALERLLDGDPEPGDGEMLAAAMRQHAPLLREASGLLAVDELLRQNAELSADNFAEGVLERLSTGEDQTFACRLQSALPSVSSRRPRNILRWVAAAAVLAGIALFALRFGATSQSEVATLLLADKCQWEKPNVVQEGNRLTEGALALRQGVAVLRFDGGAELILRGDTEVELISASQARLVRGDVTIRAPEEAAGFKLLTPTGEVVDLGTEFAATAERSGATELHVMEGEVAFSLAVSPERGGEVLHAGKAIRIDDASVRTPREVQLRADRFAEIVRAARPAARADLMWAHDGFSYPPGRLPPAEANGGLGWNGPWRAATRREAYRSAEDAIGDLGVLEGDATADWTLPGEGQRAALEVPVGTTSLARTLRSPIALDQDGVYYFSFIVREPDAPADFQFGGVRLVLRSSASPADDMLSFGPTRKRVPGIRIGNGPNFTSPLEIARNQNTLWIGKIIARRSGDDGLFFSIYGERETLNYAEPATWQVASRGVQRHGRLDLVVIAGQLNVACAVDEIRIGPTWRSVVPVQEATEVQ